MKIKYSSILMTIPYSSNTNVSTTISNATTEPEIIVENVDSTRLVTEGTLLDYTSMVMATLIQGYNQALLQYTTTTDLTTNYVSKLTDNVIIGSGATTGTNGVSIGKNAGQSAINSIVINATGLNLNNNQAGFYAAPIRNVDNTYNNVLRYDTVNKEIIYDTFTTSSSLTGREYTLEDSNNFNSINKPFPGRKTDSEPGKWHIVTLLNPGDAMNNPWNGSNSSLGKGSPSVLKPLQVVSNNSTGTDLIVKFEILMLDGTSHHFFYKNAVLKDLFNYEATTAGGTMNIYAFYQDNNGSVVDMPGLQSAWNGPFSFTANPASNVWNWPFASSPAIGQAGAMDYNNPNGYGLLVHGGSSGGTTQEDAVAIYSGAIASGSVEGWYQIRVYYWGE